MWSASSRSTPRRRASSPRPTRTSSSTPPAWSPALVAPMVAADELLGFLTLRFPGDRPGDPEAREVATSIAGQAAIAVKNLQLIERLTEHNAIKDFLEDLSRGGPTAADLADRGRALGCDLGKPHLVLQAAPRSG